MPRLPIDPSTRFDRSLVRFLTDLKQNNTREWFAGEKERYERNVRDPALAFIEAMQPRLRTISRHIVADSRKMGGSLMRIHRDTRFSRDKRPYKTNVGIQFRHAAGKDVHAPGFYLHIEPGSTFLAAGVWHPEREVLAAIRTAIQQRPKAWLAARDHDPFRQRFALDGDSLKRAPAGINPAHPLIEDLRRTDFIAVEELRPAEIHDPGLADRATESFLTAKPFMKFLCKALELPF